MRKHLRRWLNDDVLREMGDEYIGTIDAVTEEKLNNKYRGSKGLEPVLSFADGWKLCPNLTQRLALVEMFGADSDEWIGRQLIVFRHREERKKANGDIRVTWEKRVRLPATGLRRVN